MSDRLLHIITPCSRPENLPLIAAALSDTAPFVVRWWVAYDAATTPAEPPPPAHCVFRSVHTGGFGAGPRNDCLDHITDGWVWHCDDDNLPHAAFWTELAGAMIAHPDAVGFVFRLVQPDGTLQLPAIPGGSPGSIDTAMFVLRREAIGGTRWLYDRYDHDWYFFAEVFHSVADRVVWIDEPATTHNALRGQCEPFEGPESESREVTKE